MLNLAVFVSGRGSNLSSIMNKIASGELNASVCLVVSDKKNCGAFEKADSHGIKKICVSEQFQEGFITYPDLQKVLEEENIELIVLAGFLKKIPDEFIDAFRNKIINIHPALLPSFGGKGMYGMNVHRAVFEKSCQISGATVHFVDKIYDNGKIIAQKAIDISDVETPEEIASRVLKVEHELLPFVIKKISEKKVIVDIKRIRMLN